MVKSPGHAGQAGIGHAGNQGGHPPTHGGAFPMGAAQGDAFQFSVDENKQRRGEKTQSRKKLERKAAEMFGDMMDT